MEYLVLVGRILFAAMFIGSGINHFLQHDGMVQYAQWKGAPAPQITVPLTGAMILLGGLGILLGYQITWATALLVVFLVPTAFIMHDFWNADDESAATENAQFMKNMALTGAALLLMYFGGGPLSLGG